MTIAELVQQIQQVKSMSIVGMCKNAGKTTMLNWLLAHTGRRQVLGLTSIGRDGESTDVVTGTEKPSIFVPAGTLIATAKDMLRLGDVTREILMTTGIPTPLGEVIIMRARSDGYVQLAGPSITAQLREVSRMFFDLGATQSIIDGALGRKSLGARNVADGIVLCTGASYNMSMEKVIEDTANFCRLMDLPKAETLPPEAVDGLEKCLKEHGEAYIPGALTDSMVIGTSALAQYEIDGAVGMYSGVFNNPFLIWGKYKRRLWKRTLTVSFQFHHTQMDGAHASRFLENLQKEIKNLEV